MAKAKVLSEDELAAALSSLEGWSVADGKLTRSYLFPDFPTAIAFVNKVAEIAERRVHHPFISIDYKRVTLRLVTWHSGGITELDISSARAYDQSRSELL